MNLRLAKQSIKKRIQDLPLNGRNAYDLLPILPGVTNYAADVPTGSRQGTQIIVNGIPAENTAYYLDGSYDTNLWRFGGNLLPNPDALQEFRVLTSNFDAEFGRSAGGVVQAITRSGTPPISRGRIRVPSERYFQREELVSNLRCISSAKPVRCELWWPNPEAERSRLLFCVVSGTPRQSTRKCRLLFSGYSNQSGALGRLSIDPRNLTAECPVQWRAVRDLL